MTRSASIAKAREIDTKIAEAWAAYHTACAPVNGFQKEISDAKAAIKRRSARSTTFLETPDGIYYTKKIATAEQAITDTYAAAEPLARVAHDMDRDLYEGWQRFFLVEHIHSSAACSSFRPTTKVGWLPKVSGLTEAEAVAEYGAILCTICFPSAPVEMTNGSLIDPNVCKGAGTAITSETPKRTGFYSGNWAECPECGKHVGIGRNAYRIPKHK
jgi:hypothetical protein